MENNILKDVEGGEHEKQGTVWTATSHIVSALIGSGVLALAWSMAQFGWIVGPIVVLFFSAVTYYTSVLLANCYRYPDPVTGTVNHVYIDAVRTYLGARHAFLCGLAQYVNLWGTLVGYTITASASMVAVKRAGCFHSDGGKCDGSGSMFMVIFGIFQLVLSQLPSLENITWLSVVAVATSFGYSFIVLGLCIGKWVSHGDFRGTLAGSNSGVPSDKAFNVLLALGNIAFSYTFADVLIEIQDTLKPYPPENKVMKKATLNGIGLTTVFYLLLSCIGYAAFGNEAPGNILTGFESYGPVWLVNTANICVIVHLIGAYQVFAQPIFARSESYMESKWPQNKFIHKTYSIPVPFGSLGSLNFTMLKLTLRTAIILLTTLVSVMFPFFNAVLGLIGAVGFWPLAVYFPVGMHMNQKKVQRGAPKWYMLQSLSLLCLLVSVAAAIGSIADIVHNLKVAALFKTVY